MKDNKILKNNEAPIDDLKVHQKVSAVTQEEARVQSKQLNTPQVETTKELEKVFEGTNLNMEFYDMVPTDFPSEFATRHIREDAKVELVDGLMMRKKNQKTGG